MELVKYKVTEIVWNKEPNPDWEDRVPREQLPTETEVEIDVCPGWWDTDKERRQEIIDNISDELEDRYGWWVDEFRFTPIEGKLPEPPPGPRGILKAALEKKIV